MVYHEFTLADQSQFINTNGRAEWGKAYHGMLMGDGVTYQSATDLILRGGFNRTGTLNNTLDTAFRQIGDQWPCFALSKDLGTINAASNPVVFAVGLTRDPAIEYLTSSGAQMRSLYYRAQFATDQDAVSLFGTWQ